MLSLWVITKKDYVNIRSRTDIARLRTVEPGYNDIVFFLRHSYSIRYFEVRINSSFATIQNIQSLHDVITYLGCSYVPQDTAQVEFFASQNWVYLRSTVHVVIREFTWNPKSNTLEPDGPLHGHAAVCVTTQECSSATFVSLRFHFHKEKFDALLKNVL